MGHHGLASLVLLWLLRQRQAGEGTELWSCLWGMVVSSLLGPCLFLTDFPACPLYLWPAPSLSSKFLSCASQLELLLGTETPMKPRVSGQSKNPSLFRGSQLLWWQPLTLEGFPLWNYLRSQTSVLWEWRELAGPHTLTGACRLASSYTELREKRHRYDEKQSGMVE